MITGMTKRDYASVPGFVSDPTSKRYGEPCKRHERDLFSPGRCWKCGAKMRLPAMRGGSKR
jgi:hypothetical protein